MSLLLLSFTPDTFNVGRYTNHTEDWYALVNTFGQCHCLYIHRFYGIDNFMEFYTIIIGIKGSPRDLLRVGERIDSLFGLKEGVYSHAR